MQEKKKKITLTSLPQQKIKVGKHLWTVYAAPEDYPDLGKGYWGRGHLETRRIFIANFLNEENFKKTLAHELVHACFYEIGFHDRLLKHFKTKKNEELVDKLGMALYTNLIKDKLFYLKKIKTTHPKSRV